VLEERVYHLDDAPETPEPYYQPTGKELQPRPVGEENGIIVYNYNPTSAVHYTEDEARLTPEPDPVPTLCTKSGPVFRHLRQLRRRLQRTLLQWDQSEYLDRDFSYEEMNDAREILPYGEDNQTVHELEESPPHEQQELVCIQSAGDVTPMSEEHARNAEESVAEDELETMGDREAVSSSPDSYPDGCQVLRHTDSTSSTNNHHNNNTTNSDEAENDESDDSEGEQTESSCRRPAGPGPSCSPTNRAPDLCPQFSRSTVGGSKAQPAAHPTPLDPDDLVFESRFESGNLGRAIKITPTYYELYLRPDMYTNRHTQWFYFQVKNTKAKVVYRFSIINLTKPDSLYKEGMRPLMYSTMDAECNQVGWRRCGDNIAYFRNEDNSNGYNYSHYHHRPADDDEDEYIGTSSFTLSFNIEFKYDGDTVYFAHSYPYTYSDLQDYLMCIQRNPVKSKFCKLRLLCRSLAGNNVYYLTVTAPTTHEDDNQKVDTTTTTRSMGAFCCTTSCFPGRALDLKRNICFCRQKKKAVIITARVHPGESPSSWMMKGLMDFITGDSYVAKKLRHKFIFKLVPMLNPDGVIVGNTRSSLTGRDLNRQYRTVIRETYPSIWNTKAMIRRLMEDCGVAMYCDMHAHSRKHNVFIYGCENLKRHPDRRLLEQVFPLMLHKNVADKFSFENCKFKVQKNKEGTGRIVVWVLGVTNSYTLEASFGGSTMGGRAGTHFSTADYEHIGRAYCETLMDYYDDNPIKVNYYLRRIKKIRKREKRLRKAQRTQQQESFCGYRQMVRKYLWYILNLHNPDGSPPSEGAITMKLRQFTRIPVPRTADEMEAQREERRQDELARLEKRRKLSVARPYTYYPLREKPEKPFLFNWRNWFWPVRTGVRQCLWFVLNLYHSDWPPPCDEAIQRRFQHFLSIPVPRTPEELEALRKAERKAAADKPKITKRKVVVVVVKRRRSIVQIPEKLRMKILTRLSKEGSSAEEPLNIPLSDYSSDEGDTSSSSSEDEGKDSMAELEGPCCSTLKVPPSSPVLPQKLKGNKKSKKQSVPLARPPTYRRKSHSVQRIVLDIPTTEPASDFFEYTSEDELLLPPMAASDTENTVKHTFRRRNRPRRTDNIRKLTLLGCETQYLMPPELIVRSAANRYQSEDEDEQSKMVMSIIKEFPPVIGKERVWQRSSGSERPDHCQVRFSLKRSIWTGTHSDGYVNDCYNPRPISWGAPPTLVKSNHYDNEALLTACSQKLAAWKDEKRSLKEKHHKSLLKHHSHVLGTHKDKENRSVRVKITVGSEQFAAAAAVASAAKHKLTGEKKASDQSADGGSAGGGGTGSNISRVKRKTRSTLSKIVEKAEIITHLSRSARVGQSRRMLTTSSSLSTAGSPRKALLSVPSTAGPLSAGPNGNGNSGPAERPSGNGLAAGVPSPGVKPGSKFRTGGIVVTAAQPLPKMRKSYAGPRGKSTASPIKLPTTSIDIQLTTLCSETESERNVKVTTGKKHKKKRTAKEKKDKLPC
uniref:Peptidase M14 domain-containing protein n=1 Tax=Anopheles christyi TaxID=43041 RepID=A0A182JUW6_9DIPT